MNIFFNRNAFCFTKLSLISSSISTLYSIDCSIFDECFCCSIDGKLIFILAITLFISLGFAKLVETYFLV